MTDREIRAFNSRNRVLRRRILEGDLTSAVNNTPQSLVLGTLPPGAIVTGRSTKIATYFTGGGATAVGLTLGIVGVLNSIMATLNVFDTTVLVVPQQGTAGASPIGLYDGSQILATFSPDATHNLLALTAGDVTVDVYYMVPDLGANPA